MPVTDTTPRAAEAQLQRYREATPAQRVQVAVELSDAVRATALAGIRRRHPEYSEREVAAEFLRLVYGQLTDAAGILQVQAGSLDLDYVERWVAALELDDQWNAARKR